MTAHGVTPAGILVARLDTLEARLKEASSAMASTTALDETLRDRMQRRLDTELRDRLSCVAAKRQDLAAATVTKDSWSSVAVLEATSAPLLQECLAFLQGARARAAGIDGGLCEVADLLLDEIERHCELGWRRFTILAESESFTELVQLIRLRFPPAGIWDLPIAAHEYGHFATYRMTVAERDGRLNKPVEKLLDARSMESKQRPEVARAHLQELFADCFATFVLGPSYPLSSLLLRFDPAKAMNDTTGHPAPAKRFAAMTTILRRMNGEENSVDHFTASLQTLDTFWLATLGPEDLARAEAVANDAKVPADAEAFYLHLKRGLGGARYQGWGEARSLMSAFDPTGQTSPARLSVRDLLNTAWMMRLSPGAKPEAISRHAIRFCRSYARAFAS